MDPQTTNPYQTDAQTEEPSRRNVRMPGIIGRRAGKKFLGPAAKWAARAAFTAARFAFTWIVQTIAVWITILIVTISTFLITFFAAD